MDWLNNTLGPTVTRGLFQFIGINVAFVVVLMIVAYTVLAELRNSPLFDPSPEETKFCGDVGNEEPPGTFTFCVSARLKRPLKL